MSGHALLFFQVLNTLRKQSCFRSVKNFEILPKTYFYSPPLVSTSVACLAAWSRTKKRSREERVSIGRTSRRKKSSSCPRSGSFSPIWGERSPVNRAGHDKVHAKGSNRFSMRRCLVVGLEGGDDLLRTTSVPCETKHNCNLRSTSVSSASARPGPESVSEIPIGSNVSLANRIRSLQMRRDACHRHSN